MTKSVRTAAVIGAGVMGTGIAAHLANAGVRVHLLDIVPKDKSGNLPSDPAARNALATGAIAKALKHKPKPFMHPDQAALVRPGNLEDDLDQLSEADWVIEAIIENLDIKRNLYARITPHLAPHAALTSNTSGIPLDDLTQDMSADLKSRFFITHFFNPPRYLRLLEVVPGPESNISLVEGIAQFCQNRLGKGIVRAKDTPSFIANRIGVFGMAVALQMLESGYSVAEIDAVAGQPTGRPKSAAFRTADVVGLDTLVHVMNNCHAALTQDPMRDSFAVPNYIQTMLENGWIGSKGGQGFYKKTKIDGRKEILALDINTMEYGPKEKIRFASTGSVRKVEDAGQRLSMMLSADDRGGEIARKLVLPSLSYAAGLVPEIADRFEDVDRAMRWGFNWDLGPFQAIDVLGVDKVIELMVSEGVEVPELLNRVADGPGSFYGTADNGDETVIDPASLQAGQPSEVSAGAIILKDVHRNGKLVHKETSASILDLGDGVFGLEFHSKMNAVDDSIIKTLGLAVDRAVRDGVGLVISNDDENFSVGANLLLILMAARGQQWDQLEQMIRNFQEANRALRQSPVPVVAAPKGLTLGGGLEVCLGADAVQSHIECYHGLVEVGVGLIPGGGGCKEVLVRLLENVPKSADPFPYVQKAFEAIGMAKVAESAAEGRDYGYMRRTDGITMNRMDLTSHAKARVLGMARSGYAPTPDPVLHLPGREGMANLSVGIQGMVWSGYISEHDALIGNKLAEVLCGGDVAPGTAVSEEQILELERANFLSLVGEEKSQARMEHMLMKGKPLRN
ncbi:MAG: hypothetical protein CMH54_15570 [Myxococcales bacterium]|nr:hypothetical protein [Myxococcales bacterium]